MTIRSQQKVLFIGRAPFCTFRPMDRTISRHHVTLAVHTTQSVTLHAMETTNPTYVNGKKLHEHEEVDVKPGDLITCADFSFTFALESTADGTIEFVLTPTDEGSIMEDPPKAE